MGNGNAPTLQSMCFCEENCRQTYTDWTAVSPETTETGVADLFYTVLFNGFNRRGLYRMKQFYETYAGNEKVSPLVTQLSWTNHLLIMSGNKSEEEREFYMRLAIKERYSKRQLVRQMDSGYYERYMLSKSKLLPEPLHSRRNPFLDSYVVEFLDLPDTFHEDDFRKALIKGMRDFILELGAVARQGGSA